MGPELFDSTGAGAGRSVLVVLTGVTGALCFASATAVVVSGAENVWALPLAILAIATLVVGGYLHQGQFDELVSDDELPESEG